MHVFVTDRVFGVRWPVCVCIVHVSDVVRAPILLCSNSVGSRELNTYGTDIDIYIYKFVDGAKEIQRIIILECFCNLDGWMVCWCV